MDRKGRHMAYRRFVSYIYEYSAGKKEKNCGFVRVEVKNGICRLGFGLEIGGLPEKSKIRILSFVRENGRLTGIPLGELPAASGGIRGQLSFSEQQVGKSPYGMERMSGLVLSSGDGRRFATQWDDEPLRLEWLEEWKEETAALAETKKAGSRKKEESGQTSFMPGQSKIPVQTAIGPAAEQAPGHTMGQTKEAMAPQTTGQTPVRTVGQRKEAMVPQTAEQTPVQIVGQRKGAVAPQTTEQALVRTAGQGKEEMTQRATGQAMGRRIGQPKEAVAPQIGKGTGQHAVGAEEPSMQRTSELQVRQQTENKNQPFEKDSQRQIRTSGWEQVCAMCAPCQPFHDDLLTDCRKVTRQQLWQLQRCGWPIEHSQFLNYSLDRYGHLLLGRDAADPSAFYLGVPGMFSMNEQFMAGMSGYSQFRPAKPPAEGPSHPKFGYWCRRILPGAFKRG